MDSQDPQIPRSARTVKLAGVQARGNLIFQDENGNVVHSRTVNFVPLFFPFAVQLDEQIMRLVIAIQDELDALPSLKESE